MRFVVGFFTVCSLLACSAAQAAEQVPCDTATALVDGPCRTDRPVPSFWMSSASPKAGRTVDLSATSRGRGVTFAWDFDGDGAYDDATGPYPRQSFAAGPRTIGVEATDQFGRTGTERRTILVHTIEVAPTASIDVGKGRVTVGGTLDVTAEGTDSDGRVVKTELDRDGNGDYEVSSDKPELTASAMFLEAGTKVVRARVTDDSGRTATASATVTVLPAPAITFFVGSSDFGRPFVVGEDVQIQAYEQGATAAHYEYDLDGDGTFETDKGTTKTFMTTFSAGQHTVGLRATGTDGTTYVSRESFSVQALYSYDDPHPMLHFPAAAIVGEVADLVVEPFPDFRPYTVTWDADGDGDYDDGTRHLIGDPYASTEVGIPYTFTAPGIHEVGVRIVTPGGVTRTATRTIRVVGATDLPPIFRALELPGRINAGKPAEISTGTVDGTLSYDLDGDGLFDDTPQTTATGFKYTFTAPVTIAVKLTGAGGQSAVRTAQISPVTGNRAPQADIHYSRWDPDASQPGQPRLLAGMQVGVSFSGRDDDGPDDCCAVTYGGSSGGFASGTDYGGSNFKPALGWYSTQATAKDDAGAVGTTSDHFFIGSLPPSVSASVAGPKYVATASDPEGAAITRYAWDLDGDGAFDDAEGATATGLDGERLVGVMAVDAGGDVGLSYRRLSPGPPPVEFIPVPTPAPPADPELRATVEIPAIKLAALRSRGLRLNVRCTVTCHSTVVLTVDKKTAKRLGLGKKLEIGRGSGKGPAITVKLNAKARKALAKARSLKLKATVRTTRVGPYKPVVTVKTVSASR
jgi:hypothetical protein